MVTSIARQSIIIKCNMQASVLTGNYEFYYAAGLAARLAGIEVADDILPDELKGLLAERLADCVPKDEKEAYLYGLLLDYRQTGEYDAQMKELLILRQGGKAALVCCHFRKRIKAFVVYILSLDKEKGGKMYWIRKSSVCKKNIISTSRRLRRRITCGGIWRRRL